MARRVVAAANASDPTTRNTAVQIAADDQGPFHMEQVYAQRVADHGASDLLVTRAIRDIGHCFFSQDERIRGGTNPPDGRLEHALWRTASAQVVTRS